MLVETQRLYWTEMIWCIRGPGFSEYRTCSVSLAIILELLQAIKFVKEHVKCVFKAFILKLWDTWWKKMLFDRCIEDFLFWFCCAVFCGPFLPHGVTNVNSILFCKVEFFNHMLIHWQMDRILLPVLFLLHISNAYKSQRGLWGYVMLVFPLWNGVEGT